MGASKNEPKLVKHMLHTLSDDAQVVKPLTEWEQDFISSVYRQFENKGNLSDKQFSILERIYTEKTA